MMSPLLAAALAVGITAGVLLVVAGLTPTAPRARTTRGRLSSVRSMLTGTRRLQLLVLGLALGVVAALVSDWLVMILLAPIITLGMASFFRQTRASTDIELLTALETWTRSLTGLTVGGGLGLIDAIAASLNSTPPALREPVARLVARLEAQQSLERAMRLWADEIDDRLADSVASVIILGGQLKGGGVARSLDALAQSVQDQARVRQDIEAERAMPRFVVRAIALICTGMLILGMLNPAYSAPYATVFGQIVLVLLVCAFIAVLAWMRKISAGTPIPRFLNVDEEALA